MRIRAERTLQEYEERYPNAKPQLLAWREDTLGAGWKSPNDIKARYANASIIDNQRVVFNIAGNHYRLILDSLQVKNRLHSLVWHSCRV